MDCIFNIWSAVHQSRLYEISRFECWADFFQNACRMFLCLVLWDLNARKMIYNWLCILLWTAEHAMEIMQCDCKTEQYCKRDIWLGFASAAAVQQLWHVGLIQSADRCWYKRSCSRRLHASLLIIFQNLHVMVASLEASMKVKPSVISSYRFIW